MAEAMLHDTEYRSAYVRPEAHVSTLAAIGAPGEWRDKPTRFPAFIERDATVREFVTVHAGCDRPTHVGQRTLLMAHSHVGHDAQIGADCEVAPGAVIGGCVTIGHRVKIGMNASILPYVKIGSDARIGAGAVVTRDVPAGETWVGSPAKRIHKWEHTA